MDEPAAKLNAWLQSVFRQRPTAIRALYVELGDAVTPDQDHLTCFHAFGFESLAGGRFDPSNPAHLSELGAFLWEPSSECVFRTDDHLDVDWMEVLRTAASSPETLALAAERGVQFLAGEHDGEVFLIG